MTTVSRMRRLALATAVALTVLWTCTWLVRRSDPTSVGGAMPAKSWAPAGVPDDLAVEFEPLARGPVAEVRVRAVDRLDGRNVEGAWLALESVGATGPKLRRSEDGEWSVPRGSGTYRSGADGYLEYTLRVDDFAPGADSILIGLEPLAAVRIVWPEYSEDVDGSACVYASPVGTESSWWDPESATLGVQGESEVLLPRRIHAAVSVHSNGAPVLQRRLFPPIRDQVIVVKPDCTRGAISGRVVTSEGRGVPEADVRVQTTSREWRSHGDAAITGAAGQFHCGDLPPGEYSVMCRVAPQGRWWPGPVVDVVPGDPSGAEVLVLVPALQLLEVTLRGPDGRPVSGVHVRSGGAPGSGAMSDPGGRVTLSRAAEAGDWVVAGAERSTDGFEAFQTRVGATNEEVDVLLSEAPMGRVRCRTRGARRGDLLAVYVGTTVSVLGGSRGEEEPNPDPLEYHLEAGECSIALWRRGSPLVAVVTTVLPGETVTVELEVPGGASPRWRGRVLSGRTEEPLAGAVVSRGHASSAGIAVTDGDGAFALSTDQGTAEPLVASLKGWAHVRTDLDGDDGARLWMEAVSTLEIVGLVDGACVEVVDSEGLVVGRQFEVGGTCTIADLVPGAKLLRCGALVRSVFLEPGADLTVYWPSGRGADRTVVDVANLVEPGEEAIRWSAVAPGDADGFWHLGTQVTPNHVRFEGLTAGSYVLVGVLNSQGFHDDGRRSSRTRSGRFALSVDSAGPVTSSTVEGALRIHNVSSVGQCLLVRAERLFFEENARPELEIREIARVAVAAGGFVDLERLPPGSYWILGTAGAVRCVVEEGLREEIEAR